MFAGAFTAVAVLGAVIFWLAFSAAELRAIDSGVRAQAQVVHAGLRLVGPGVVTFEGHAALPGETSRGVAIAAELVDRSGKVIASSSPGPRLASLASGWHPGESSLVDAEVSGQKDRVLIQAITLDDGRPGALVLARSLSEYDDTLERTALFLVITVTTLVLVASVSGYVLAGRALAPVREIAATARDISQHDLNRRIALDLPPDELGELAETFNGMLERLEAAFASLQRFTADAAHELRTPLALMRTEVQFALRAAPDVEEQRATLQSVLDEVEGLTRMADQLLLLARADSGTLTLSREEVDADELVEDAAVRWHATLEQRGIAFGVRVDEAPPIFADRAMLRRVLDNLIDNAARHTPRGGTIGLQVAGSGDGVEMIVSDSGGGVAPHLRGRLFERFTRSDPARARDTGGAGLGLSICAAIAALHDGDIRLEEGGGPGASFRVWLPAVAEP